MKLSKIKDKIISAIFNILIFTILSSVISQTVLFTIFSAPIYHIYNAIIVYFIAWSVVSIVSVNKKVLSIFSVALIIFIVAFTLGSWHSVVSYIKGFINWAYITFPVPQTLETYFGLFVKNLILLGVFVVVLVLYCLKKFKIAVVIFGLVAFIGLVVVSFLNPEKNYLLVNIVLMLTFVLLYILAITEVNKNNSNNQKNKYQIISKRIVAFVCVSLLSVNIINTFPLNTTSKKLISFVDNAINESQLLPNISDSLGVEMAGHYFKNTNSPLGGNRTFTGKTQFIANSPNSSLYLKVDTFDTYTGSSFKKSKNLLNLKTNELEYKNDVLESSIFTFKRKNECTIKMENYSSKLLPVPQNLYEINADDEILKGLQSISTGQILSPEIFTNETFTFKYDIANINVLNKTLVVIPTVNYKYDTQQYLQLPNSVTQRTKDLAKSIATNIDTSYIDIKFKYEDDTVKQGRINYLIATQIQKYLQENYKYTLTPNEHKGKDFVDSFLFEHGEGYCTSFATALVVMLRSLNIPCSYIYGYSIPQTSANEYAKITDKNAHAWVEIYLDKIGTVYLDATPGEYIYDTQDNIGQESSQNESSSTISSEIVSSKQQPSSDSLSNQISSNVTSNKNLENSPITNSARLILFAFIILMIILSVFIIVRIYVVKTNKQIAKALISNNTKTLYTVLIGILATLNIKRNNGETVREFIKRVFELEIFNKKQNVNFNKIIIAIESSIYGGEQTNINVCHLKAFVSIVNDYFKVNSSSIYYFIKMTSIVKKLNK